MVFDDKIKKNWFVFTNGLFFNDNPRDDDEKKLFDSWISEARRYGLKVQRFYFQKTEKEFYNK